MALVVANIIMILYLIQKENITKYDLIVILILFTIYIINNFVTFEQFDSASNEAIQTLAGLYNNGTLTVPSLNLTGNLTVAGNIKCKTRINSPVFNTGTFNIGEWTDTTDNTKKQWRVTQNDNGLLLLATSNTFGGDNNKWPYFWTTNGWLNKSGWEVTGLQIQSES